MNYPYECLAYVARLSFRDAHGLEAVFDCYQRLRVLGRDLRFIENEIWGDGDQLNRYVSTGATPILVRSTPAKTTVTSRLDSVHHYGDEVEIYSTRRIHHAFKGDERYYWEYKPLSPTERARISISFPVGREPTAIAVGATVGSRSPETRRPGTKELVTTVSLPTLNSLYRMSWSW